MNIWSSFIGGQEPLQCRQYDVIERPVSYDKCHYRAVASISVTLKELTGLTLQRRLPSVHPVQSAHSTGLAVLTI
jgi:hypothetical protein